MKRRTWRWVTRPINNVRIWPEAKKPHEGDTGGLWCHICPKEFKRLFGFLPKVGEVLKVEFAAKVVK